MLTVVLFLHIISYKNTDMNVHVELFYFVNFNLSF